MFPQDPADSARARARVALARGMSAERMAPYRADAEARGIDALSLYCYNMALAAALLGPLNVAETVTRNAMQRALGARFGREDWWNDPQVQLPSYHRRSIMEAQEKLRKKAGRSGRDFEAGDVVAALEFGFWTGLLGDGPGDYDFERELWQPALRAAFPNSRRQRDQFRKLLDAVRRLRNRVTHHEPLYRQHHQTSQRYEDTLLVIAAVDRDLRDWVDHVGTARQRLRMTSDEMRAVRF
ncbi:hypothetical protein NSA53_10455 [Cellulosimicrobium cellulans]|uniref:hypothetical protein n=1 Tax=Cellulosimicrobium cellulans TaxID=1710 RepID=UPI002149FA1A|nr:hypothetical protein [Cellulosimicrobium cellulans]